MKVGKVTAEYLQEPDDYDESREMQIITLTAEPVLLHLHEQKKEDYFIVIETKRFAFNDEKEVLDLLKDFKKRIKEIKQ